MPDPSANYHRLPPPTTAYDRGCGQPAAPDTGAEHRADQALWHPGGDHQQDRRARLVRYARARRWPAVPPACPPELQDAAAAVDDPEPYVAGSFDDVVPAYDLGRLCDHGCAELASAAAGSAAR